MKRYYSVDEYAFRQCLYERITFRRIANIFDGCVFHYDRKMMIRHVSQGWIAFGQTSGWMAWLFYDN